MKHPADVAYERVQRLLDQIIENNKLISRDVEKLNASVDEWSSSMRELVEVSFDELRQRVERLEERS